MGEVRAPGIYNFDERVTIYDAIKRAGGLRHSLSFDTTLESTKLKKGEKITVQRISKNKGRVSVERMGPHKLMIFSIPIDLNTATQEELSAVSGLGSEVVLDIVKYRHESGGFSTIEELKDVKGIGKVRYENIKRMLTVVNSTDTDL